MFKYIFIALLFAGYHIRPSGDIKCDLEIKKYSNDIYLLIKIDNISYKDYYINDWQLFKHLKFFNSQGIEITKDFIKNEFYYQTRIRCSYKSNNKKPLMNYSDLYEGPITRRKQLLKKAINIESNKIINNQQLDSNNRKEIKEILFWKYADAIFIKAQTSYQDSISITTLFRSEYQPYKLILGYALLSNKHKDTINIKLKNKQDSIAISYKPLNKINDYLLYDQAIKDTLWLK